LLRCFNNVGCCRFPWLSSHKLLLEDVGEH
jgi:hypothetical protein